MAESTPYVTLHDINVVGAYQESTKGTAPTSVTYNAVKGTLIHVGYSIDDQLQEEYRDGDGPMPTQQSRGLRMGTLRLHYKVATDLPTTDSVDISLIEMAMGTASTLAKFL